MKIMKKVRIMKNHEKGENFYMKIIEIMTFWCRKTTF